MLTKQHVCLEKSGTELQVESVHLRLPTAGFVPSLLRPDLSSDNRVNNNIIVWFLVGGCPSLQYIHSTVCYWIYILGIYLILFYQSDLTRRNVSTCLRFKPAERVTARAFRASAFLCVCLLISSSAQSREADIIAVKKSASYTSSREQSKGSGNQNPLFFKFTAQIPFSSFEQPKVFCFVSALLWGTLVHFVSNYQLFKLKRSVCNLPLLHPGIYSQTFIFWMFHL